MCYSVDSRNRSKLDNNVVKKKSLLFFNTDTEMKVLISDKAHTLLPIHPYKIKMPIADQVLSESETANVDQVDEIDILNLRFTDVPPEELPAFDDM